MSTIECSCRLCPSPGMYAVTSSPFERRTRATFRSAEFGFFGVMVLTFTHTPRLKLAPFESAVRRRWSVSIVYCMAGLFDFMRGALRPRRMSWLIVGMDGGRETPGTRGGYITNPPEKGRDHYKQTPIPSRDQTARRL